MSPGYDTALSTAILPACLQTLLRIPHGLTVMQVGQGQELEGQEG